VASRGRQGRGAACLSGSIALGRGVLGLPPPRSRSSNHRPLRCRAKSPCRAYRRKRWSPTKDHRSHRCFCHPRRDSADRRAGISTPRPMETAVCSMGACVVNENDHCRKRTSIRFGDNGRPQAQIAAGPSAADRLMSCFPTLDGFLFGQPQRNDPDAAAHDVISNNYPKKSKKRRAG